MAGNLEAATARVAALLPSYIEKVMVQSDLTIIAPGPLRPEVESKLRRIATTRDEMILAQKAQSSPHSRPVAALRRPAAVST